MYIGQVKISPPVILAPMAGVTDLPYRKLVKKQGGVGLVCTEMVSAKGLVYGNQQTQELLTIADENRPVSLQLFGHQADILAEASQIVAQESNPEIIDLNVGCPAPKIVKDGSGAALMKTPNLLAEIVEAMVAAVTQPITVKIRAGWEQEQINAVQIAQLAEESGAQAVAVHGRTREQFYQGQADWQIINQVSTAVSIPVLGNGDIFTPQAAEQMMAETNCVGVMIARAAQGNPWIFSRTAHYLKTGELLSTPTPAEKIKQAITHLEKLVAYKGEYVGIREMRKHVVWYLKGLRNCTTIKQRINQTESLAQMKKILNDYRQEVFD